MYAYGVGVLKDVEQAIHWIRKAAEQGSPVPQNNLSWFLATSSDAKIRNGKEAIKWAKKALSGENNNNIGFLDTLAVAYAETKDFESAVKTIQKIQKMLDTMDTSNSRRAEWIKMVSERMKLFKLNKPFRDNN